MTGKAFDPKAILTPSADAEKDGKNSKQNLKESKDAIKPINPIKLIGKPSVQREPGVPELLAAIKVMMPLVKKQLENPNFNASQYLDEAISVAHRIGGAAIDNFTPTRFLVASLTSAIINEEVLTSKTNEVMVEGIVKQIFERNDSDLNKLILQLADAFQANHPNSQDDLVVSDEDIIRAALMRNSEKIMSDVAHFSFWSSDKEQPELANKMIQIVGEVSVGLIDKITDLKTVRARELMIASVIARTASVVSECYRSIAYKQASVSREENNLEKKAVIRKNARDSLPSALKEMVEVKMDMIFDSAMSFCKTDITANTETPK